MVVPQSETSSLDERKNEGMNNGGETSDLGGALVEVKNATAEVEQVSMALKALAESVQKVQRAE